MRNARQHLRWRAFLVRMQFRRVGRGCVIPGRHRSFCLWQPMAFSAVCKSAGEGEGGSSRTGSGSSAPDAAGNQASQATSRHCRHTRIFSCAASDPSAPADPRRTGRLRPRPAAKRTRLDCIPRPALPRARERPRVLRAADRGRFLRAGRQHRVHEGASAQNNKADPFGPARQVRRPQRDKTIIIGPVSNAVCANDRLAATVLP